MHSAGKLAYPKGACPAFLQSKTESAAAVSGPAPSIGPILRKHPSRCVARSSDGSMNAEAPLRPRDLALLLLASRDLRPRQRARDQQADVAGLDLKRRVLDEVAALDPEPDELDAALMAITARLDVPSGPA